MKDYGSVRNIVFIWLGWASVMLAFQQWTQMRVDLQRPDNVLFWTASETMAGSQSSKPYLVEPFMSQHVAWDSEYYLSVAIVGYEDPAVLSIPADFTWNRPVYGCETGKSSECYSLNYAFFPLYSMLTRVVASPLTPLPLTPIARNTLAAVTVSLLGSLGAMLALHFMTRTSLGEDGGIRAAFYLLISPSGFFLAQVYTEGLFIGLTFGALAFLLARKWGWSALLAALAVWTRPGGALLLLPLGMVWFIDKAWQDGWKPAVLRGLAVLTPALSYGAWSLTPLADKFHFVEDHYFNRALLTVGPSFEVWEKGFQALFQNNMQAKFYYGLEFTSVILALLTCFLLWKERPELSAFSLAMIVFAFTSGVAQGMIRYVLVAPSMFWILARWGRNPAFDRVWSTLSILLMGLETMLFSFDFWVA